MKVLFSMGVGGGQLREPATWAVHHLEAQADFIHQICGIDNRI